MKKLLLSKLPLLVATTLFVLVFLGTKLFDLAAYKPIDVFACGVLAGLLIAHIHCGLEGGDTA